MTSVYLGLDIGTKRTGAAVSRSGVLATPIGVAVGTTQAQIDQIKAWVREFQVTAVVVGIPGSRSNHPVHKFIQKVKDELADTGNLIEFLTVDETLSSKEAERLARLSDNGLSSDAMAAKLILEDYFEHHKEITDAI